ncbi:MAG: glutamate--tRNA ligase [Candidatus Pacebacteria bacterium]|nr:glutamate--tRNA ligase [Candidatus Paceibacterota bacterium]
MSTIRTRIAPSPTGYPHVGTAFQALFDWAYARQNNGQFIMRLEDTDQKRFVKGSEEVLYQVFDWLGLVPDESPRQDGPYGPYRQSERLEIYQKFAQQLIDQDQAYYCFCSKERLERVRQKQQAENMPPMYDQYCRQLPMSEVKKRVEQGEEHVIRLKVPPDQTIKVQDKLRGVVEFDSNTVDDQVIIKSDGFPTYHLAVVVDDHLMKISHMVRGEEWLPSAPKHILLYQYFGWEPPVMIHTPTLRGSDKSKLSKRSGNTSIWWYREHGFVKEALLNFLALIGWSEINNQEIYSLEQLIKHFTWDELKVTGPVFDVTKLEWMNGKYLRRMELGQLVERIKNWANWVKANGQEQTVVLKAGKLLDWHQTKPDLYQGALKLAQDRAKTLPEFYDLISFFFNQQLDYELADLLQGHSVEEMTALLQDLDQKLAGLEKMEPDSWEQLVRQTADEHQMKHRDAFMSMRSTLTAQKFTPPLFDIMLLLGKEESAARFGKAVSFLQANAQ